MSRSPLSATEIDRLLKELQVDVPRPAKGPPLNRRQRIIRRLRMRAIVLALCALAALIGMFAWTMGPAGDPAGPAAMASDPRFGVVEALRLPGLATRLGVGWERLGFSWRAVQQDGPDSWNQFTSGGDGGIASELAAGRHLAAVLINTPDWAAANPSQHGASPPKGLYLAWNDPQNYWGHFVGLIVKRYAGRIDDWIIWNEMSIATGQWSTWRGSVQDYAQLVKVAYLAAKDANPHARIVLGGDPYWYDRGAFFTALLRQLTADPEARAHNAYFDVANLHLYSRPSDIATVVDLYRRVLARFGLHKPIWIGETNAIPYNDPVRPYARGNFLTTEDDQASYIIQAFAIALTRNVERIEVNRMLDGTDFSAGGEPFGLVRNDGTVRPAFWAYRTVVNLFSGVSGGTLYENRATGVYRVLLHRQGATITVLWDQRPAPVAASIPAQAASAMVYDKFGQGRVVQAHGRQLRFMLAGATDNTNSADPHDYLIGGSPVIVVQSGGHS